MPPQATGQNVWLICVVLAMVAAAAAAAAASTASAAKQPFKAIGPARSLNSSIAEHAATLPLKTLSGHNSFIEALIVRHNGHQLISGSWDEEVKLWDMDSATCLNTLTMRSNQTNSKKTATSAGNFTGLTAMALRSEDELVVGLLDGTLRVWRLSTRECVATLTGHLIIARALATTRTGGGGGGLLATGALDSSVKVWNVTSGECVRTLRGHTTIVNAMCVEHTSGLLVSAGGHTLKVWNLTSGECLRTLTEGHESVVVAVGACQRHVVSGSADGHIRVWSLATGQLLRKLAVKGPRSGVTSLALDCGEQLLLAAGHRNGQIRLWRVESGECVQTLSGHTDAVTALAIVTDGSSPSTSRLVSGSLDKKIKIWLI